MRVVILALLRWLLSGFHSQSRLVLENLALRHQLAVPKHSCLNSGRRRGRQTGPVAVEVLSSPSPQSGGRAHYHFSAIFITFGTSMCVAAMPIGNKRAIGQMEFLPRTRECANLDPKAEQALAEEGFTSDLEQWPEY